MYYYIKALHIIFVVTWFAGLFYFPRLFIYNTEANDKPQVAKDALQQQFSIMMKRLWYGITWPSAVLTLIFGITVMINGNWTELVFKPEGKWLLIKLIFVVFLYAYHLSLHKIFKQQINGIFSHHLFNYYCNAGNGKTKYEFYMGIDRTDFVYCFADECYKDL